MTGKLNILLAMPGQRDKFFNKSVILLVEDDESGSMGFAINIKTGKSLADMVSQIEPDKFVEIDVPILLGGPVKTDFLWVMHDPSKSYDSTLKLFDELHLSAGQDVIPDILKSSAPEVFAMGVGYSGWQKGQLEREINDGAWWKLSDFAFNIFDSDKNKLWESGIKELGINLENFYGEEPSGLLN